MKSRAFALCTANLVPLLALGGAGASSMLLNVLLEEGNQRLGLASRTPGTWISVLACAIAGLLCLCIALWWIAGLAYYYSALARAHRSTVHIRLPAWAPGLLKTLAGASLGLGALAPTQAYALPSELAVSVTAEPLHSNETSSPLFAQASQAAHDVEPLSASSPLASTASPFFSQGQTQEQSTITVLPVSTTSYQPISPLFSGSAHTLPDTSEHTEATYTVTPGDSLWSIAENQLAPDASGAEVLALVHAIWQLNQDSIPTLDTLIFPGQTITLPH